MPEEQARLHPPTPPGGRAGFPIRECHGCLHWQPGTVVVRGSTQGWCQPFATNTPADFGCDVHSRLPPRRKPAPASQQQGNSA